MLQYRAYIKDVLRITDKPKSFLVVKDFKIRRDLLTTASSSFKVLSVPTNIDNGDIFTLYDGYGKIIYTGVITKIEDNEIQCQQIQSIFKGNWVYCTNKQTTLEAEVAEIMKNYTKGYINPSVNDPLMIKKFGSMTIEFTPSNKNHLETKKPQTIQDFESFIYELYRKYNLVVDVVVPYEGKPIIKIETPNIQGYKLANNNNSVLNITPVTEIAETNKLVIYDSNGNYRDTYFATGEGITKNPNDPLRLKTINTNIQFSDDDIQTIVASNLPNTLYNHKLEFNLALKSNLYNWHEWILGQPLEIYKNNNYFKTIYTGYELEMRNSFEPTSVRVICGMVRTKLTKKLTLRSS